VRVYPGHAEWKAVEPWRILGDRADLLAKAFQIFRTQAMKSGEGQFLTPQRIIRPCVMAMEVTSADKVIDPACGNGGFLIEALRQVQDKEFPGQENTWRLVKFANDNLYGVDMDPLGVKLTKATMIAMQAGSTHTLRGDSIRKHLWPSKFPELEQNLALPRGGIASQFTVVLTNPPFWRRVKGDCRGRASCRIHDNSRRGARVEGIEGIEGTCRPRNRPCVPRTRTPAPSNRRSRRDRSIAGSRSRSKVDFSFAAC
jgi:hypothetical protein